MPIFLNYSFRKHSHYKNHNRLSYFALKIENFTFMGVVITVITVKFSQMIVTKPIPRTL